MLMFFYCKTLLVILLDINFPARPQEKKGIEYSDVADTDDEDIMCM
jgi:hypothetical protein